jgi:hypothetical protein
MWSVVRGRTYSRSMLITAGRSLKLRATNGPKRAQLRFSAPAQVSALLNYRVTGMGPLFARCNVGGRLAGTEVESTLGHRDLR